MLTNPFTPSEIASNPNDFFGRTEELKILERSIQQGSVIIHGPIGIGKSSLLSHIRLHMGGFNSHHKSKSIIAVGNKNIDTIDHAAHLLLSEFVTVDQEQNKIAFKIGSFVEFESSEVIHNFKEGRHLAVLNRLLEKDYLSRALDPGDYLILAIDEADKCPIPLTRLIRSISTFTQQQGIKGIRFALAGVTPFFKDMVAEDPGVSRFFYKTINLLPMIDEEAEDLLETKFKIVASEAKKLNIKITIEPALIRKIYELSGGHPHLLQLLGSHLIESEDANPDGKIDKNDLVSSIRKICYEDRGSVYNNMLHRLELFNKLESFRLIISNMNPGFPSRISRSSIKELVSPTDLEWLIENSILSMPNEQEYGLIDEFLRAKIILDNVETDDEQATEERYLIEESSYNQDFDEDL